MINRHLFLIALCLLLVVPALAEDRLKHSTESLITFSGPSPDSWIMTISPDGQLSINGKPIERMDNPELKETMKKIADAIQRQTENNELLKHYDRQTEYLLRELEKCLLQKGGK